MEIYGAVTGHTYDQIEAEFDGRGYGDFKAAVGEAVVAVLAPIQERFRTWMADKAQLDALMKVQAERAAVLAGRTLNKVKKKMGFVLA